MPKSPPKSNMLEKQEDLLPLYDEHGDLLPVVELTPVGDSDEDEPCLPSTQPEAEPLDRESFNNHQKELFEMQCKQLERLKESTVSTVNPNLNLCNDSSEHSSSSSVINQVSTSISSSSLEAKSVSNLPQSSTLDSVSVNFAVSAVADPLFS